MIKTGLPYDMGSMDEIKNNGALVDMSDINFPGIPDDKIQRTTFIFLRNTGFNVTLDFSNCDYTLKEKFLLSYLNEDIDVKENEFASTYVKIFNKMVDNNIDIESILSDDEINLFIDRNKDFINKLLRFIISLPIFAMFYFSLNDKAYTLDDIEKTDDNVINENFYHIISNEKLVSVFDNSLNISPMFYNTIFRLENEKLFHSVEKLPFFSILHGLSTLPEDEWKNMLKTFDEFENTTKEKL